MKKFTQENATDDDSSQEDKNEVVGINGTPRSHCQLRAAKTALRRLVSWTTANSGIVASLSGRNFNDARLFSTENELHNKKAKKETN